MIASNSDILESKFKELYRPLCLYALNYTGKYEDAEDIVQQLFAELWERETAGKLEIANVKSYLYTAVKNRGLKFIQRARAVQPIEDAGEVAADENSDEEVLRAEREARLWDWIDELPTERRNIFLMAKQRGMKYKEIAGELGISVKTVENQMGKALQSLRAKVIKIYLFFFGRLE